MREKVPDLTGIPITRLPPGKAHGADDLMRWSHNRAVGASGMGETNTRSTWIKCGQCDARWTISACRNCGYSGRQKMRKVV